MIIIFFVVVNFLLLFNYYNQVDDNMARSQKKNALLEEKFWFRNDIFSRECDQANDVIKMMTISEIINGNVSDLIIHLDLFTKFLK